MGLSEFQWVLSDKVCTGCNRPKHYNEDDEVYWCFYCDHHYVPRKTYRFPNIEISPDAAYVRSIIFKKIRVA